MTTPAVTAPRSAVRSPVYSPVEWRWATDEGGGDPGGTARQAMTGTVYVNGETTVRQYILGDGTYLNGA